MSGQKAEPNQPLSNFEWLAKYFTTARDIKYVFNDDLATVKKRLVDKNKEEMENGADADWYTKIAVKNFIQSVSKTMANLTELKMGAIKELRKRYPLLEEEWLRQESLTFKVPNNTAPCNGEVESLYLSNSHADKSENLIKCQPYVNGDMGNINEDKVNVVTINCDAEKVNVVTINCDAEKVNLEVATEETEPPQPDVSGLHNDSTLELANVEVCIPDEGKLMDYNSEKLGNCVEIRTQTSTTFESQRCKTVVDDQVPGPSRLSHLSPKRLARAKRRVTFEAPLPIDSSDEDFDEPLAKIPKKSMSSPAIVSKVLSKSRKPICSKRGPLSRRSNNKVAEKVQKESESDKVESSAGANKNYWTTHDYKKDPKLNERACVVVVKKDFKSKD